MKCPHEAHVVYAATTDSWTSSVREHVASCPACAAAASVAPFMQRLADSDLPPPALPDPALLWLRSQLPPPSVALRVGRPVHVVQVVCYLLVTAASMGVLALKWSALQAWVSSFAPVSGSGTLVPAMVLSFMVLLLSSLVVTLALHTVLADEG